MEENQDFHLHNVFTVDPCDLRDTVGRYVNLKLLDGTDLYGTVYTIDPVSQSCILIQKQNKSLSMKIILKHSVSSMRVISDTSDEFQNVDVTNLFNSNMNERSQVDFTKEKDRVKSWLVKNMTPVDENGDILTLDTLEIHPPYGVEDCYCSNPIVLDRVQKLLRDMREKDQNR